MKANRNFVLLLLMAAVASTVYAVHLTKRAVRNLVTLDVRNMEVRRVARMIERQTWESISVDKSVQGNVTLNVKDVPLEEVLQIVGEQTSSRSSAIYPLYSSRKSLAALKQALRGEIDPATHGWTNLPARGFEPGPMFGGGPRGEPEPLQQRGVSLKLYDKDVTFATTALNRFYRVRVVPEDGISARINLTLDQTAVQNAVAQMAKKTGRKWTTLYALQGRLRPGGPPQYTMRGNEPFGDRMAEVTAEEREQRRQAREALDNQLAQALPDQERERLEEAKQKRTELAQEMQNLTPEQRRERFAQLRGGPSAQRTLDRIKNTTPEQRAQQFHRMAEMRQRMQQRQQQNPPR